MLKEIILHLCALPAIAWVLIYTLSNLYMWLMGPVDLKKKYKASWALVSFEYFLIIAHHDNMIIKCV